MKTESSSALKKIRNLQGKLLYFLFCGNVIWRVCGKIKTSLPEKSVLVCYVHWELQIFFKELQSTHESGVIKACGFIWKIMKSGKHEIIMYSDDLKAL